MEVLSVIGLIVGIVSGLVGVAFGLYEFRGKRAEQAKADRAERVQEQMAAELETARRELSGARQAQERLADTEVADARRRELLDRREASAIKRHRSKVEKDQMAERKAAEKASKDQAKANKADKDHQRKMQKEAEDRRKAEEKFRRERSAKCGATDEYDARRAY